MRAAREGRVSHAQMFLGPEGSGTLPLAIAYAQYLLCSNKGEDDSCGQCPSCLKLAKLEHPDVHFSFPIVKEGKTEKSDDQITAFRQAFREQPYLSLKYWYGHLGAETKSGLIPDAEATSIISKLNYKSYEGEYKVLIMWRAELMNISASNHLLKIIEEPPENTVFILVAENQEDILPTIISRTQIVKVLPLRDEEIEKALHAVYQLDEEQAASLAQIADGNLWMAISSAVQMEEAGFNMQTFRTWMLLCHKRDLPGIMDWVDGMATLNREQQRNFIRYGLHVFRQCLVGSYTDNELLKATDDERDFIFKFSSFVHGNNIINLNKEFNDSHYQIERNANSKLVFLNLSFKVIQLMFPRK